MSENNENKEYELLNKEYTEEVLIEIARKRVKLKRELFSHITAYVLVNAFLVFLYWIIMKEINFGPSFWPIWVISGWGLGLLFHIFETIQELNFKYNVNVLNKELENLKKQFNVDKKR